MEGQEVHLSSRAKAGLHTAEEEATGDPLDFLRRWITVHIVHVMKNDEKCIIYKF